MIKTKIYQRKVLLDVYHVKTSKAFPGPSHTSNAIRGLHFWYWKSFELYTTAWKPNSLIFFNVLQVKPVASGSGLYTLS